MSDIKASTPRRSPPRPKVHGPKALTGSSDAKRQAAILLEVLAGLRSASDASATLEISIMRYYMIETRALRTTSSPIPSCVVVFVVFTPNANVAIWMSVLSRT